MKDVARKIDMDELRELSIVGGEDGENTPTTYSLKTTLITLTVVCITITSIFSVGEACSYPG